MRSVFLVLPVNLVFLVLPSDFSIAGVSSVAGNFSFAGDFSVAGASSVFSVNIFSRCIAWLNYYIFSINLDSFYILLFLILF